MTCFRRTLFPIPDCPTRTSDSPFATVRSSPESTVFVPKLFVTFVSFTAGGAVLPRAQNSTFVRKKSAMRMAREPMTTAFVVERPTPSAPPVVS